jgi:pilus assembly protein CpaC
MKRRGAGQSELLDLSVRGYTALATGRAALFFAAILCATGPHPAAQAAERAARGSMVTSAESVERVEIILNKSQTFTMARAFSTATVGNSEIAEALPISDRVLYVQGKKEGTTNISIFDATARLVSIIDVDVVQDGSAFQARFRSLHQAIRAIRGGKDIRVTTAGGQIVLSGVAPDAVSAERAVSLAKSVDAGNVVNAITVAGAQQVMLKVRFLEVHREAGRELGVNWFVGNRTGTRGANIGLGGPPVAGPTNAGIPIIQSTGALVSGAPPFGTVLTNLLNNGTTIDVLVSALETKNLVRRLAEPDLVALSGDTAAFLAGGEQPVPSVQPGTTGGAPVITIEYKPFGVQLTFTPTVLANGKINLRLAPSVSEISGFTQISGAPVPTFSKREARTTIELRDGQSFAIAGLLQASNRRDISQLPWIGSVPVLGTLFSSKSFQQDETDLVVIVTPHVVAPAAPGQRVASPLDDRIPSNDADFFLFGEMELRKQYNDFVAKGGGVQGPYGHMMRVEPASPPVAVKN